MSDESYIVELQEVNRELVDERDTLASRLAEVRAERDEAVEAAFARGVNFAQNEARVEGRLEVVDSVEIVELRDRADRLAREVERLRPIVDELATWQPLEVDDLIHRARAALASEQGETHDRPQQIGERE